MIKCPSGGIVPPRIGSGLPEATQYTFASPPKAVMVTRKMYRNPPLK